MLTGTQPDINIEVSSISLISYSLIMFVAYVEPQVLDQHEMLLSGCTPQLSCGD